MLLSYPQVTADPKTSGDEHWQEAVIIGLIKSSKRPKPGSRLRFGDNLVAIVEELLADGKVRVRLRFRGDLDPLLANHGRMPLPLHPP